MFFVSSFEHSLTSHAGSAWALTPWTAVQQAARDALDKLHGVESRPPDWTATDDSPVLGHRVRRSRLSKS